MILQSDTPRYALGQPIRKSEESAARNGVDVRILQNLIFHQHARPMTAAAQMRMNAMGGPRGPSLAVRGREMHDRHRHVCTIELFALMPRSKSIPSTKRRCQNWNIIAPQTLRVWSAR